MKHPAFPGFLSARQGEPFVIAEMSGNHNQSLDRAMSIVEAAARAGAHALKIQTFTPDTMTLDLRHGEFVIADPRSPWRGEAVYELYKKAQTPWEWHAPLFARARELGMIGFSSPFDETAVEFLESLDVPLYKIASFENTDLPLIRKVAATGKPVIMSTGMATAGELELSVRTAREAGCTDLTLLKCTSTYPATPENSHLRTIPHMRELYDCPVGLSDHTLGVGAAVAAVALGAPVIEKHLTLARAEGGVDSSFSLEPDEFAQLIRETRAAWLAMGQVHYGPTQAEAVAVTRRRSVYVVKKVRPGDKVTRENIRCIRPGHGLAPRHFDALLGRTFRCGAEPGTPMSWALAD